MTLSTQLIMYEADGVINGNVPIFARFVNKTFSAGFFHSSSTLSTNFTFQEITQP
jgi:hypothetical protein